MENEEENELVVADDAQQTTQNEEVTEVKEGGQENVEPTEKTYSQTDVDRILDARSKSLNRKHQKELQKYKSVENTLKQGMKLDNIDDISRELNKFYKEQGVEITSNADYHDDREDKILAKADADEIIALGENEMIRRANELAGLKRNARENEEFMILGENLTRIEAKKELKQKGIDEAILDSSDFKEFASQFNSNIKMSDIYDIYSKTKGLKRKQPRPMESLANNTSATNEVKDFYTRDEALKFTVKDFDRNPKLYEAVEKSMENW